MTCSLASNGTQNSGGEFILGYLDKVRHELAYVSPQDIQQGPDVHFSFEVTDEKGIAHSVPYHRVKEGRKDSKLIWHRMH